MVPSLVVCLEIMPKTPGGKLDRNALPAPDWDALQDDAEFESPRNQAEEQLAAIWAEVLGLKRVGTRDNFFELGGHSLSVIQVISRTRETFNVELPASALFDAPTVKALAQGVLSGRFPLIMSQPRFVYEEDSITALSSKPVTS
jgi:acyl carrier protein